MSISLSNHESRISKLEKGYTITKLTPEPIQINRTWKRLCSMAGYKFIYVVFTGGYQLVNGEKRATLPINGSGIVSYDVLNSHPFIVKNKRVVGGELDRLNERSEICINPDMTIDGWSTQSELDPPDNYVMIFGLNLYYKLRDLFKEVSHKWLSL